MSGVRTHRADHRTYRGDTPGVWCGHDADHTIRSGYRTEAAAARWVADAAVPNKRTYQVRPEAGAFAVVCAPVPELRVCTCGGTDYASCLCNLSPREWLAYAKTNPRVDQGLTLPKGLQ